MPRSNSLRSPLRLRRNGPALVSTFALCLVLLGCSALPSFEEVPGPSATTSPSLVPIGDILTRADAVGKSTDAVNPVTSRADALRARADRLRRQ